MKETSDKLQIEAKNKMAAEFLVSQLQSEVKRKVNWKAFLSLCVRVGRTQSDNIAKLDLAKSALQSNLNTANDAISKQNEVRDNH